MPHTALHDRIWTTLWLDTHEHLLEESTRLAGPYDDSLRRFPCDDWAFLLRNYGIDDLVSAGLPMASYRQVLGRELSPHAKWSLVAPYWQRVQNTGYLRALRASTEALFGLRLAAETVDEITRRMHQAAQPGFYRRILRHVAGVRACQVNSVEATFCPSEQPDLLRQDLAVHGFSLVDRARFEEWQQVTGIAVDGLASLLRIVDWYFDHYGHRAVAVKSAWAYARRLAVAPPSRAEAQRLMDAYLRGADDNITPLQDYVFTYCVERAAAAHLPIKLHTGYFAGNNDMPLARVQANLADLCPVLSRHRGATFVLMHIAYPYQNELLALCKHWSNVVVDLCWAWSIDPISTTDFVRRFLVTAPVSKLLCFGGDVTAVENVPGHAELARRGLFRALSSLVDDGFFGEHEALMLVDPLMHGNARAIFPLEGQDGPDDFRWSAQPQHPSRGEE